ncbi:MAG TPA: autotransporter assembly complex family protein [Chlamydiales bacterium]|nr:autotransporter assembly complex family protein [Chlamydiales bacterium]
MTLRYILGLFPAFCFALTYEVEFIGMDQNQPCLLAIQDASQLVSLQKRPPASLNGLRYRMASDIPAILRVLHAFAYYDASIETDLEIQKNLAYKISIFIESGPQFNLASYEVYNGDCKNIASIPNCHPITPVMLGLNINEPALSIEIVNGELNLLHELAKCGYPLAYIDKRRVEVDMASQIVQAAACVQEGPLSKFGPSTFFGLRGIQPRFIQSKIGWTEGQIYNSNLIDETQERLLKTELFSSVYISHDDNLNAQGELPMKLRFTEANHQKISLGAFYGTVDGPGFSFAWIHRNISGNGDTLSARGDVSPALILGNITYKKPDFLTFDQTYRAFGELSQENIKPYHAFIYRFANYIDRTINPETNISLGMKLEHIHVFESASNGTYLLLGAPFFIRYYNADNFLDPTRGLSICYSITPYQSLFFSNEHFMKQRLTSTFYIPMGTPKLIFAFRAQFGSIAGTERDHIPLSKLFLGGSENELRGYRYKTVSPLNHHNKPLGGRSAIYATAEIRWKVTKTIGIVPFLDLGTVTSSQCPDFTAKWRKSVGGGFRYFTFFGPLRFDIGFPLNKRKIDHNFQIYASIGQAF